MCKLGNIQCIIQYHQTCYPLYLFCFCVRACGGYLASEHERELVQDGCVHEYAARGMFRNARDDDVYRYDCVNECGL